MIMVLYETKVLLVTFAPQMSGYRFRAYDKGEPVFLLWITFLCITLVVCRSEIIASESS